MRPDDSFNKLARMEPPGANCPNPDEKSIGFMTRDIQYRIEFHVANPQRIEGEENDIA